MNVFGKSGQYMSTKYTYADVKYADEKPFPEEHILHIE